MACGIYKITNLVNGHVYIGQSVDIKRRWRNEKSAAFNEKSRSYNTILSKAFRKYCIVNEDSVDFSCFSFEILEECSVDVLNEREQYYISKYNSRIEGYNMTEGGFMPHVQLLTPEHVLQIIDCLRSEPYKSSEQIGKEFGISGRMVRNINSGACHRFDSIDYPIRPKFISNPRNTKLRGTHAEQKPPVSVVQSRCPDLNILFEQLYSTSFTSVGKVYGVSATAVQKWLKEAKVPSKIKEFRLWYQKEILKKALVVKEKSARPAPKSVVQYSLTGTFLHMFPSLNSAATAVSSNNYGSVHIKEVCEGKRKSAYGYCWRFGS